MGIKSPVTVFGYTVESRVVLFKAIGRAVVGEKRIQERYGGMENYLREVLKRSDDEIVAMLKSALDVKVEYTFQELTTFAAMQQALREYVENHNVPEDQARFSVYGLSRSKDFARDLTNYIVKVKTRIG